MCEKTKLIATASEMSNLVNCYALLIRDQKLIAQAFVLGKASNEYFILQFVSPLDGNPNICKLKKLDELTEWVFIPNKDLAEQMLDDYYKHKIWRFNEPGC